jgi:hypothetical protein
MPAKGFVALVRLFLAAVLLTTLSRAASPALNPDFTDAVWIAESERVLKVTRAEGSVLFEIPEAGAVTVLGIDVERGILWAYGEGKLFRYDFAGQRHTVTSLSTAPPPARRGGYPRRDRPGPVLGRDLLGPRPHHRFGVTRAPEDPLSGRSYADVGNRVGRGVSCLNSSPVRTHRAQFRQ